jgi:hypothetical protein
MKDKFSNDPWGTQRTHKEEDILAQEIFGIKYFSWLDFWEQHHIVVKNNLDDKLITK